MALPNLVTMDGLTDLIGASAVTEAEQKLIKTGAVTI